MRTLGLLTLLGFLSLSGCGPWWTAAGGVSVWAVPDGVTVFADTPAELENDVYSDASRTIRLDAAVNETVAFQLVFRGNHSKAAVWGITVKDLVHDGGVIPADRIRFYRQIRVPVSDYPAWYLRLTPNLRQARAFPDPLIPFSAPRGALPIELEPNQCSAVWAEIRVPSGTPPGIYRSTATITFGTGIRQELHLVLNIWPFALPQTPHLAVITGLELRKLLRHQLEVDGRAYAPARLSFDDPAYSRATLILDNTLRLLHDHRCNTMFTDIKPVRHVGPDGSLQLDWTDYDRLVSGVLDGTTFGDRVPAIAWPMPVDQRDPSPDLHGGWGSEPYERMLVDYLRQCVSHFLERQWLDRHYVRIPVPGSDRGERYQQFEWLGRLLRRADTRLRTVCELTPQSMTAWGWVDDAYRDVTSFADIWAPPGRLADRAALAERRSAGNRIWLTPDRPPYTGSLTLFAPPENARNIAWQAYRFGCQGVFIPKSNDWPEDDFSDDRGVGLLTGAGMARVSERALIWPGKPYGLDRPIPSIRLKRLLRGAQDYEYLWLLERNRRPAVASRIAADLFPFGGSGCYVEHFLDGRAGGWISDPAAWALARRLMARELILVAKARETGAPKAVAKDKGLIGVGDSAAQSQFKQQMEWARYAQAVRQVRTAIEGVRVRFDEQDDGTPVVVKATVSLFNATPQTFSGTLAFLPAGEGWKANDAPEGIEQLAPLRAARRVVRARTDVIRTNVNGVLPIQIARSSDDAEPQIITGRLCALSSQCRTKPIVMDGKLDDWPMGLENVAGDFLLVGALDVPKRNRPSPDRASQSTIVSVCNDEKYLYVGFSCQDSRLADRRMTRSNYVRYDDLWPVSEDLVEVILDPTGKAVAPGDVLHIVVKANGAVITEHGVPCLSRVAEHRYWASGVEASVDDETYPDRWTVEIRVPLASLGELADVWGVNFGRFQARLGEYSSWSGAQRYLYSPVTLGNMRLAR